jgi:hypothetical protein
MLFFEPHLALVVDPELSKGQSMLKFAIEVNVGAVESWKEIWNSVISPDSGLWVGLCRFASILAGLGTIFMGLKMANDFKGGKLYFNDLAAAFVWPLVIMFFLGTQGTVLANTIHFFHSLAYKKINEVLQVQIFDLKVQEALEHVALSEAGKAQIEAWQAECLGLQGEEFKQCLQTNQAKIDELIDIMGGIQGFEEEEETANQGMGNLFSGAMESILTAFLHALQWAFVNSLEASMVMASAMAPIALGLSLLPMGSKPIWAWASSFTGLFAAQIGYTILVGLIASILAKEGGSSFSDLAFLSVLAFFAPTFAMALASFGGVGLFMSLQKVGTAMTGLGSAASGAALKAGITVGANLVSRVLGKA